MSAIGRRALSLLLALVMAFGMLPMTAMGLDTEIPETEFVEEAFETESPEETQESLPEETQETLPEETEETLPEQTQETLPATEPPVEETVSETTAPMETVPETEPVEETVPETTAPEETIPQEADTEAFIEAEEGAQNAAAEESVTVEDIYADVYQLTPGSSVELKAVLSDPEAEAVEVLWDMDCGEDVAQLVADGATAILTVSPDAKAGGVTIYAYTENSDGEAAGIYLPIYAATNAVYITRDGANVTKKTITADALCGGLQLEAYAEPADAQQWFVWTSSDEKIAAVDESGWVSFSGKAGTVEITAAAQDDPSETAVVKITAVKGPSELKMAGKEWDLSGPIPVAALAGGKSLTLKAVDAETGDAIPAKKITWRLEAAMYDNGMYQLDTSPFATLKSSGKLTAKKVLQRIGLLAVGQLVDNPNVLIECYVEIFPAVTHVEILDENQSWVNGRTIVFNRAEQQTMTFTALQHPGDACYEDVEWTISDKKNAYADYETEGSTLIIDGASRAKAGTVTFKAVAQDGSKKSATVKVKFGTFATELVFPEDQQTTLSGGSSLTLEAEVFPADVDKDGVTWKLKNKSDSAYLTVKSSGKITAKKVAGIMQVPVLATSKDGMVTEEILITVEPAEDTLMLWLEDAGIYVTRSTQTFPWTAGKTMQLKAVGTEAAVEWSSSKESIATVEEGLVTFHKAGKVKITAQAGDLKETVTFSGVAAVQKLSLAAKDGSRTIRLLSGKNVKLAAKDQNGKTAKVTWSIEEGGEFATISKSGDLKAAKDLPSAITVRVRATANDVGGVSATIDVSLVPQGQGVQIYTVEDEAMIFRARTENWWVRSNAQMNWDLASDADGIVKMAAEVYPYYDENDPRNAAQGVTWKSSSAKVADFLRNADGSLKLDEDGNVQLKVKTTGSVTITATANDGSKKKATVKIKVVKNVTGMEVPEQLEVVAGKSLKLAEVLEIVPGDTTTKKFTWEILDGSAYGTVSSKGVFKSKKSDVYHRVAVQVTAQDDLGCSRILWVDILPNS